MTKTAVLLIGHGGVPTDFPREQLLELKRLEGSRRGGQPSRREAELDDLIRNWQRSAETDPFQAGMEAVRRALQRRVELPITVAYNEFCAPSIEQAIDNLVSDGVTHIRVITSMLTRGGSHAELEIPEALAVCRARHPNVVVDYLWPFDESLVAELLAQHLDTYEAANADVS